MKRIRKLMALMLALCLALALCGCARELQEAVQLAEEISGVLEQADAAPAAETAPAEEAPEELILVDAPAETAPAEETPAEEAPAEEGGAADTLDPDGWYTTKDEVALYLRLYGELPGNFITKDEARALGWSGGGLDGYADGKSIGGDRFGNYEGLLPEGSYHECDLGTMHASSRGAERLVYSDDGRIYYTNDHYESFTLLYGEE